MLHKAAMLVLLVVFMVVISLLVAINIDKASPQNPLPLSPVKEAPPALLQAKVEWPGMEGVAVVRDEPDLLELVIDYHYAAVEGERSLSLCGQPSPEPEGWRCEPVVINAGDRSALVRLQLTDTAPRRACSKHLVMRVTNGLGEVRYNDTFLYRKTWVKGGAGWLGRLQQLLHTCVGGAG